MVINTITSIISNTHLHEICHRHVDDEHIVWCVQQMVSQEGDHGQSVQEKTQDDNDGEKNDKAEPLLGEVDNERDTLVIHLHSPNKNVGSWWCHFFIGERHFSI